MDALEVEGIHADEDRLEIHLDGACDRLESLVAPLGDGDTLAPPHMACGVLYAHHDRRPADGRAWRPLEELEPADGGVPDGGEIDPLDHGAALLHRVSAALHGGDQAQQTRAEAHEEITARSAHGSGSLPYYERSSVTTREAPAPTARGAYTPRVHVRRRREEYAGIGRLRHGSSHSARCLPLVLLRQPAPIEPLDLPHTNGGRIERDRPRRPHRSPRSTPSIASKAWITSSTVL